MNDRLNKTNENINYVSHTNSSAICWNSSSSNADSLATLIKNTVIVLPKGSESGSEIRPKLSADH
jgi:hypothetical protein